MKDITDQDSWVVAEIDGYEIIRPQSTYRPIHPIRHRGQIVGQVQHEVLHRHGAYNRSEACWIARLDVPYDLYGGKGFLGRFAGRDQAAAAVIEAHRDGLPAYRGRDVEPPRPGSHMPGWIDV